MEKVKLIATAAFGLEAVVKRELKSLGIEDMTVTDGSVEFEAPVQYIPILNINLRSADRVLLVMGKFKALSFEELFENTKKQPWGDILPKDAHFVVTGKSIRSTLYSVPDCQSITEKAIVEKLKEKYHIDWFEKSGAIYKIQVAILRDVVTLTIDTSGDALHKRGYRSTQVIAPLKETMAAAMIDLSYWKKDRIFLDPCCGSGTLAIEAALISRNIAPGISRKFAAENWDIIDPQYWKEARTKAYSQIDTNFMPKIYASDIDPEAIAMAKANAENAGVDDCIEFNVMPFNKLSITEKYGVCISNPPYAERMGVLEEVEQLYRDMGKLFRKHKTWSVYIITSHEDFEKLYGRRADKKRKLFNGNVKIDYYQFYGERPPRLSENSLYI